MRQRHAQMLQNRRHRVEPVNELVQSTDQSWHHIVETCAALIIAG
ncbi:hypothetical protein [Kitasatospora sp. NPDC089509]